MSKLCYLVLKKQVSDMRKNDVESIASLLKSDLSVADLSSGGVKQPDQSSLLRPIKTQGSQRRKRFYSGCLDR